MAKFVSDLPTLPPDGILVAESAMIREYLLLLDPAGVECLPRVLAASRGALYFSSNAAFHEALPRIMAYWLRGSHSSWAPQFRFVRILLPLLLKALHYDHDEIDMENFRLSLLQPISFLSAAGKYTRVWSAVNTHKYRAPFAGLQGLLSMMLPVEYMMKYLVDLMSSPVIRGVPNQCILHSAPSTLADPRASKAHKLSRKNKKEPDTCNAGSFSITQEYSGSLNFNVTRIKGDTIMKQSGLFSEPLHNVNLYENNEFNISSCDRMWLGVSSEKVELMHRNIATAYKLSRKDNKELDKEKDCSLNAGSFNVTQDYDGSWNLNVARTTGDTIMKQSRGFPEHLNTVDFSENDDFNVSSSDHTWFDVSSSKEVEHIHGNIATFFVKVEGTSICVQQNLSTTTTKMLVEHACEKKGIRNYDGYAVYLGKALDDNNLLSDCKVCNNCTVELRGRGRAGRKREIECTTLDDEMKDNDLFRVIPLPKTLTHTESQRKSATFLSGQSQWRARQVLISLCRMHYRKKSLNGKFNASHILFHDGRVVFDESCLEENFTEDACRNDYRVIAEIFARWFRIPSDGAPLYPLFVGDLLKYLRDCPLGHKSNSVAAIALPVNHPALTTFMDRMAQCTILDSMVDRLTAVQLIDFEDAVDRYLDWRGIVDDVLAMRLTLVFDSQSNADPNADPKAAPHDDMDSDKEKYNNHPRSCLKFARNHFKHARIDLLLERVEASFSLNLEVFLPKILQDIVQRFEGPPTFDIVTLLGNNVADMKRLRDALDAENPAEVIASPAKRPKISFGLKKK